MNTALMLSHRLHRLQQELLAHRLWLRQHTLTRNVASSTISSSPARAYATATGVAAKQKSKRRGPQSHETRGKDDGYSWKNISLKQWQKPTRAQIPAVASLEQALEHVETFGNAIAQYRSIQDKSVIPKSVLVHLTLNLVHRLKLERAKPEKERDFGVRTELDAFAGELVRDVKNGNLEAVPKCNTHLIRFYRESENLDAAIKFWQWLEKQQPSERYISTTTYAAVLETLAVKDTPLHEIEKLYREALAKFPQSFAEYHFTPNALVPDKNRELEFALPLHLLQGIMLARVMRNDTRSAYLALDTALRLQPSKTSVGPFRCMMDERGVAEAYTIFATACRAGSPLSANIYRKLLARLRESTDSTSSPEQFVATLRAMISATYMHVGGGGQLTKNAITEVIISITQLMRLDAVSALPVSEKRKLAEQVQEIVRKLITSSQRFKALPGLSAFNSIITNLAGFGQSKEVASVALTDIERLGLQPNVVTCRSILTAAGALKHEDMIKESWKQLVLAIADEGKYPDSTDAYILIKACVNTDVRDLARAAIQEMQHLEDYEVERLLEGLESMQAAADEASESNPQAFEHLTEGLSRLTADIDLLDTRTADSIGVQDFSAQSLPMLLTPPPSSVALPEPEMRKLYDEVTTDPSSPQPPSSSFPQKSQTGILLSELRYENWKTMTYLLAQAVKADEEYLGLVDRAIATGARPPARHAALALESGWGVGLSDDGKPVESNENVVVAEKRRRIKELRGLSMGDREEGSQVAA